VVGRLEPAKTEPRIEPKPYFAVVQPEGGGFGRVLNPGQTELPDKLTLPQSERREQGFIAPVRVYVPSLRGASAFRANFFNWIIEPLLLLLLALGCYNSISLVIFQGMLNMTISFELPPDLERDLEGMFENIGQVAKEAFILQGYQDRRFGMSTLRRLLGVSTRWEAEQWLADHHVGTNYSIQDLDDDRQTLQQVFENDA